MKLKFSPAGIALFASFLLIGVNGVTGQQPNVSLGEQMEYITAPLDFTEVTSGLLLDRGFQMMNVADFDGSKVLAINDDKTSNDIYSEIAENELSCKNQNHFGYSLVIFLVLFPRANSTLPP